MQWQRMFVSPDSTQGCLVEISLIRPQMEIYCRRLKLN